MKYIYNVILPNYAAVCSMGLSGLLIHVTLLTCTQRMFVCAFSQSGRSHPVPWVQHGNHLQTGYRHRHYKLNFNQVTITNGKNANARLNFTTANSRQG